MGTLGSEISQTLANCIVSASLYALIGVGFGMIHRAGRFFHLAHGAVFTAGAYAAFLLFRSMSLPQWGALPVAMLLAAALGPVLWLLLYRPIRRRDGGPLALLLGSLGANIVIQYTISLAFGDANLQIRTPFWGHTLHIGGAFVTYAQLALVLLAIISCSLVAVVLRSTRLGVDLRAVGDDPFLAANVGIDAERVLLWTLFSASLVVGAAGIVVALDTDMRPTMGLQSLLLGISASMLGGIGELRGLLAAAVVLGAAQHLGAWIVGIQWSESFALLLLFLILVLRPRGIQAYRRRAT